MQSGELDVIETIEEEQNEFFCTCEHVDYSTQLEYIANVNTQIYHSNLFIISMIFVFFLGYLFYKLLKFFI